MNKYKVQRRETNLGRIPGLEMSDVEHRSFGGGVDKFGGVR